MEHFFVRCGAFCVKVLNQSKQVFTLPPPINAQIHGKLFLGFFARRYQIHLINVSPRALQLGCQSNDGTSANGHNLPNSDILCAGSIFISEINLESNLVELLSSLYRANRGGEMMFFYPGSDRVFRNLHKLT